MLRQTGKAKPCGRLHADEPVGRHGSAAVFEGSGAARPNEPRDQGQQQRRPLIVGEPVIPGPHERADDRRSALRMVAPGLASDESDGLHGAHLLAVGVVGAVGEGGDLRQAGGVDRVGFNGHQTAPFVLWLAEVSAAAANQRATAL